MAKNKGTFSYIETQEKLEELSSSINKENLVYELLRIFCNYGNASIQRIIDGKGNDSKDGKTVLVKKLVAYRATEDGLFGDDNLYKLLDSMRTDINIKKKEPRLYIVSDGKRIIAYDPKEDDLYDNDISLLWKDFDFFKPLAGIERFRNIEEAEADVKSAEMMAKIYDDIRRYNDVNDKEQIHNINVFMSRLLFCFFAEDTNLFPVANMFTDAIREDTKTDGSDLAEFLDGIFDVMAINDKEIRASLPKKITQFPYVNGGLFKNHIPVPKLSRRTRLLMLKCGEYNWAEINPDIFGSMIQAVINPKDRAGLGIHYTSVPNIMKVIKPLFLDELTEEFVRVKDEVKKLRLLLQRIGKIKFFDPACGSGNFLIISYKCIRELEIEIWERIKTLQGGQAEFPFSNITLQQFYGIEIDEYACDTATLSLWLAEHQMNNKFHERLGTHIDALPLRPSGNIFCGNACRLDWNAVCPHTADEEVYVMGNPPYLGARLQEDKHKADMEFAMRDMVAFNNLDYIATWFYLGAKYVENSISKLAFVSTNSICQGEQVAILWKSIYEQTNSEIWLGYKAFKWKNNAKHNAGVCCSIIGLRNKSGDDKIYIDGEMKKITPFLNAYLIKAKDIVIEKRSKPINITQQMDFGSMPNDGGNLILTVEEKIFLQNQSSNTIKYIKRFMGSQELIKDECRFCLWIEDDELLNAKQCEFIDSRIIACQNERLASKREATNKLANKPHRFGEVRYQPTDAIIVPSVSSERREYIPIGFVDKETVISNLAFAVYDAELWLFALLTSKIHNVWVRAVGGKLEERIRYSATLCYNTFPFPRITKEQKERLTELAEEVLLTRENHTEMTLGEMYNPETMPDDLKEAHKALDIAVEQCYRIEPFSSDDERLEYLFKLYEKTTKKK